MEVQNPEADPNEVNIEVFCIPSAACVTCLLPPDRVRFEISGGDSPKRSASLEEYLRKESAP